MRSCTEEIWNQQDLKKTDHLEGLHPGKPEI